MKIGKKILLITTLVIMVTITFTGFKTKDVAKISETINYKNFGVRYDNVNFDATPINAENVASKDVSAALHILDVVDKNLKAANNVAYASTGSGTASSSLMNMSGALDYGIIFIKDNGAFYLQSAADVTDVNSNAGATFSKLTKGLLDQAERRYSPDGKTVFVQKVKGKKGNAKVFNSFPFCSADYNQGKIKKYSLQEYYNKEYIKSDFSETSNLVFSKNTIAPESIKLDYKDGLYKLSFDLNLKSKGARDEATKFARPMLREMTDSKDLEFNVFKVDVEVWDSGLVRKYTREESWEGHLELPLNLKPKGLSQSTASIYYSWDPANCSIKGNKIDLSWAK